MGPFDNESGTYILSPIHADGHWFHDRCSRALFIVPADGEIEGPDDDASDLLADLYRATNFQEVDPRAVARHLKLEYIEDFQRRFDAKRGYYFT